MRLLSVMGNSTVAGGMTRGPFARLLAVAPAAISPGRRRWALRLGHAEHEDAPDSSSLLRRSPRASELVPVVLGTPALEDGHGP